MWLIACVILMSALGGLTQSDNISGSSRLSAAVQSSLEKRSHVIRAVRLELTQTLNGPERPESVQSDREVTIWLHGDRFRGRVVWKGRDRRQVIEAAFDGHVYYIGEPDWGRRTPPAVLVRHDPWDESDPENKDRVWRIYFDYLRLAGFHVPRSYADFAGRPLLSSLVLHHQRASKATTVHAEGLNLRVTLQVPDEDVLYAQTSNLNKMRKDLEGTPTKPEFIDKTINEVGKVRELPPWRTVSLLVDPRMDYAVLEQKILTESGMPIRVARSDRWKYYDAPNLWLPGRITEEIYTVQGSLAQLSAAPRLIETWLLKLADFNDAIDIQFNLQSEYMKPATHITDFTGPAARESPQHRVDYRVAADGTFTKRSAQQILAEIHDWRAIAKGAGIVFALLALPPIGYLVVRRWRLKRSQE